MHRVRLTQEARQELESLDLAAHPYITSVRIEQDRETHSVTLYFKLDGATCFTVQDRRNGQRNGRRVRIKSMVFSPKPSLPVKQPVQFGNQVGAVGPPDNQLTGIDVGTDTVVFSLNDLRTEEYPGRLTWTDARYISEGVFEVTFHRAKLSDRDKLVTNVPPEGGAVTDLEVVEDTEDRSVKVRVALAGVEYYRLWVRTSREPGEVDLILELFREDLGPKGR